MPWPVSCAPRTTASEPGTRRGPQVKDRPTLTQICVPQGLIEQISTRTDDQNFRKSQKTHRRIHRHTFEIAEHVDGRVRRKIQCLVCARQCGYDGQSGVRCHRGEGRNKSSLRGNTTSDKLKRRRVKTQAAGRKRDCHIRNRQRHTSHVFADGVASAKLAGERQTSKSA